MKELTIGHQMRNLTALATFLLLMMTATGPSASTSSMNSVPAANPFGEPISSSRAECLEYECPFNLYSEEICYETGDVIWVPCGTARCDFGVWFLQCEGW